MQDYFGIRKNHYLSTMITVARSLGINPTEALKDLEDFSDFHTELTNVNWIFWSYAIC